MRCIRHALRTTPSPEWWKRVLLVAPGYRSPAQGLSPGAVFTSEMICEATIDRIFELLKLTNSGNCNFFVIRLFILPHSHDIAEGTGKHMHKRSMILNKVESVFPVHAFPL